MPQITVFGTINKKERRKLLEKPIAETLQIWYDVCIQVDYAYSTTIGMVHQKRRIKTTVRRTVRQCGDLS